MRSALVALFLVTLVNTGCETSPDRRADQSEVEGLWRYTNLVSSGGQVMPLTGIFLFKDGVFLQQAVFDGEPFDDQMSMAHAGPYSLRADGVHLIAEETISLGPTQPEPLSFQASTEHDVTVARDGQNLTLTFGSGTVQEFAWVGPGRGDVYELEHGNFALVDDHFVLVHGTGSEVVTGYGRVERRGETLTMDVTLWSESDGESVTNLRDTGMTARFDGAALTLGDGRSFTVVP